MANERDGGFAFPIPGSLEFGMTLRDYFAGQALIAFMSSPQWTAGMDKEVVKSGGNFKMSVAVNCYLMADCMMEVRNDA